MAFLRRTDAARVQFDGERRRAGGTRAAARARARTRAPEPTSGRATIPFGLPAGGRVRLTVYDPSGRAVAELVDRELAAGRYEVAWDGRVGPARGGEGGSLAPAGVYFYRLRFGGETRTGKIALLR